MLLLAGACAAWALDNNLTQRLSLRDPIALARIKALGAGAFNLALGLLVGGELPEPWVLGTALFVGKPELRSEHRPRRIHAAAAYFATAPFVGALAAAVLLREPLGALDVTVMAVMAAGVASLLRERHSHEHARNEREHAHMHVHDEHHQHEHGLDDSIGEPHARASSPARAACTITRTCRISTIGPTLRSE